MSYATSPVPPLIAGGSIPVAVPGPTQVQAPPIIGGEAPGVERRGGFRINPLIVILAMFLLTPLLCVLGVASFFHLSSPTRALRESVMDSVPGQWDKRFAINAGPLTVGVARFVSGFIKLPPEARAALQSVHGAEVGIYHLRGEAERVNYAGIFEVADKAMTRRGWDRIVGVAQDGQLVAVYAPRSLHSLSGVSCCVAVFEKQDLVIVSARGNIEPLLELPQFREGERNLTR